MRRATRYPDPSHKRILRQGARAWNRWRKKNPDIIPVLDRLTLAADERVFGRDCEEPINLSSTRLRNADLRFVTLSSANLQSADLSRADLSHARLQDTDFSNANLNHARLDHADLTHASLRGASLHKASLRFANLSLANLEAARLSGADLTHAQLNGTDLGAANVTNGRLSYANFTGAKLKRANLRGANFENAKNLTQAHLAECRCDASTLLPVVHPRRAAGTRLLLPEIKDVRGRWRHLAFAHRTHIPLAREFIPAVFAVALMLTAFLWWSSTPMGGTQHDLSYAEGVPIVASETHRKSADTLKWRAHTNSWPVAKPLLAILSEPDPIVEVTPSESFLDPLTAATPEISTSIMKQLSVTATGSSRSAAVLRSFERTSLAKISGPKTSLVFRTIAVADTDLRRRSIIRTSAQHGEMTAAQILMSSEQRTEAVAPALPSRVEAGLAPTLIAPVHATPIKSPSHVLPSALKMVSIPKLNLPETQKGSFPRLALVAPEPEAIHARVLSSSTNGLPPMPLKNVWRPPREPMTIVVSLKHQEVSVYSGAIPIARSKVSTGKRGHDTPAGVFSILEKRRSHFSNLYDGAPMPWMQRITWSGFALHGGVVPGYPASHGCVRLPHSFAPELFHQTKVGEHVVVAKGKVTPQIIDHPALFEPLGAFEDLGQTQPRKLGHTVVPTNVSIERETPMPSATMRALLGGIDNAAKILARADPADPSGTEAGDLTGAPLRILVTRRTKRDQIRSLQDALSSLGYLAPQNFDGTFGKATVAAIRAFQANNDLPKTGAFSDELAETVYREADKPSPPQGHLFVRQAFRQLFDMPVAFTEPEKTLGTHIFTTMNFEAGNTQTKWMAISLEGGDAEAVLDRIKIPPDAHRKIAALLTPGSSLIIGDKSQHSAILPKGHDFIVWTEDQPNLTASVAPKVTKPTPQKTKVRREPKKKAMPRYTKKRKTYVAPPRRRGFRLFRRR